jgi:dTDP-4-dehydrorhamnose 3,5-epimerase
MQITYPPLSGLIILKPKLYKDDRGYFFESFQQNRFRDLGLPDFVQENTSYSKRNCLRGLHYQLPKAQGKLVWVSLGSVLDIVVDLRRSSKTFCRSFHVVLDANDPTQFYIPPGFAHGFCVLSDEALFNYKCSEFYSPQDERGLAWTDRELNLPWPTHKPLLSTKDQTYPQLKDIVNEYLFP